jgi:hypothetical protein
MNSALELARFPNIVLVRKNFYHCMHPSIYLVFYCNIILHPDVTLTTGLDASNICYNAAVVVVSNLVVFYNSPKLNDCLTISE